jgi:hypothetical protein
LEKVAEAAVLLRQKSLGLSSARSSRLSGEVFYDTELGVELDALILHRKALVCPCSAKKSIPLHLALQSFGSPLFC